jgi:HSP20 family protein
MKTQSGNAGSRYGLAPWMPSLFDGDDFWNRLMPATRTQTPAVNISEDDKSYTMELVAPGFSKEEIRINVDDDMLTISAEKKTESKQDGDGRQYSRREYSYSSFSRSFTLPQNAKDDAIKANYQDGVLTVVIPKSDREVKSTKQIPVS